MAFFKLKKRCPYCGTALDENGNCPNTGCINYQTKSKEEETSQKEG